MSRRDLGLYALGSVAVVAGVLLFVLAMDRASYDVFGALLIAPVLVVLALIVINRASIGDQAPRIRRIMILGLVLKLVGTMLRYFVAFDLYGGSADAAVYSHAASEIAAQLRDGVLAMPSGPYGTQFMKLLTGIVYFFVGPTRAGGFLIYSFLAFLGMALFYRAFCIGMPNGDHVRYCKLVFFMPTMLFWPSSIGKESWMCLTLGLTAYAVARVLTSRRGGFPLLVVGMAGANAVRPHVALITLVPLVLAFPLARSARPTLARPFIRLAGVAVLVLGLVLVRASAATFLGVETIEPTALDQTLTSVEERTSRGGSEFDAPRITSPLGFPAAVASVLVRPLPHEAHNLQSVLASVEGVFLVCLFVASSRRLANLPREILRRPYLLYACLFAVCFIVAFSSVGNFGILARERSQVLPFVLTLVCLPLRSRVLPSTPAPPQWLLLTDERPSTHRQPERA